MKSNAEMKLKYYVYAIMICQCRKYIQASGDVLCCRKERNGKSKNKGKITEREEEEREKK